MSEMKNTPNQARQESEIAIKFGKGLAQPFTGKDGTPYMRIKIPNADAKDKSPWQYFVVPAKTVHENQFGKGLWIKLPLHGSTSDHILTLITCDRSYGGRDGRLVVMAVQKE